MTINTNEQGGINYKHSKAKVKAEKDAEKASTSIPNPDKVAKPEPPAESKQAIENGGVPIKPPVDNGDTGTLTKTLHNTDQNAAKKNVSDLVTFGGDLFKLMSKASSELEGWMKSTKSFDTGRGCIVQVTTQQRNKDGSYAVAEALTFVPGVKIKAIKDLDGNVVGRTFTGAP